MIIWKKNGGETGVQIINGIYLTGWQWLGFFFKKRIKVVYRIKQVQKNMLIPHLFTYDCHLRKLQNQGRTNAHLYQSISFSLQVISSTLLKKKPGQFIIKITTWLNQIVLSLGRCKINENFATCIWILRKSQALSMFSSVRIILLSCTR